MAGRFIELSIRGLALAAGLGAGVAGGFTINQLLVITRTVVTTVDPSQPLENFIRDYNGSVIPFTQASSGLAIGLAILGLFITFSLFYRICKCCDMGSAKNVLYGVDLLIIVLCIIGFGVGGVLGAMGANLWSNLINDVPAGIESYQSLFDQIRIELAATSAVSLLAFLMYGVLLVWMIVFTVRNHDTLEYEGCI